MAGGNFFNSFSGVGLFALWPRKSRMEGTQQRREVQEQEEVGKKDKGKEEDSKEGKEEKEEREGRGCGGEEKDTCIYVPRNLGICAISRLCCAFSESRDCAL